MEALRVMTVKADPDKNRQYFVDYFQYLFQKTGNTLMQDLYTDVIMFIHFAYTDNMRCV